MRDLKLEQHIYNEVKRNLSKNNGIIKINYVYLSKQSWND